MVAGYREAEVRNITIDEMVEEWERIRRKTEL